MAGQLYRLWNGVLIQGAMDRGQLLEMAAKGLILKEAKVQNLATGEWTSFQEMIEKKSPKKTTAVLARGPVGKSVQAIWGLVGKMASALASAGQITVAGLIPLMCFMAAASNIFQLFHSNHHPWLPPTPLLSQKVPVAHIGNQKDLPATNIVTPGHP